MSVSHEMERARDSDGEFSSNATSFGLYRALAIALHNQGLSVRVINSARVSKQTSATARDNDSCFPK